MIVEVYDSCYPNETYSDNGINITLHRCVPDDEVSLKFEDDGGKVLFKIEMRWKDFKQIVTRLENEVISK